MLFLLNLIRNFGSFVAAGRHYIHTVSLFQIEYAVKIIDKSKRDCEVGSSVNNNEDRNSIPLSCRHRQKCLCSCFWKFLPTAKTKRLVFSLCDRVPIYFDMRSEQKRNLSRKQKTMLFLWKTKIKVDEIFFSPDFPKLDEILKLGNQTTKANWN